MWNVAALQVPVSTSHPAALPNSNLIQARRRSGWFQPDPASRKFSKHEGRLRSLLSGRRDRSPHTAAKSLPRCTQQESNVLPFLASQAHHKVGLDRGQGRSPVLAFYCSIYPKDPMQLRGIVPNIPWTLLRNTAADSEVCPQQGQLCCPDASTPRKLSARPCLSWIVDCAQVFSRGGSRFSIMTPAAVVCRNHEEQTCATIYLSFENPRQSTLITSSATVSCP